MTYQEIFADIYLKYGKKSFTESRDLPEKVREVCPDISSRQMVVIDHLSSSHEFEKLYEAAFQPESKQDILISAISSQMYKDFFIPAEQTRECAEAFMGVFQHGSRAKMNELEQEYDESMAPTMEMDVIDEALETNEDNPASAAYTMHLNGELDESDRQVLEESDIFLHPGNKKDEPIEIEEQFYVPQELVEEKEIPVEGIEHPMDDVGHTKVAPQIIDLTKDSIKPVYPLEEEEEGEQDEKKAGRIATAILAVLFILLIVCGVLMYIVLKDMNIL